MVDSLIEFLDIAIILTDSSEYRNEIKNHIDVAKDLFKNSSIFNDKAHQYVSLAYRMVNGGVKYQKPPELDEFVTPAEAQGKALKYAKKCPKTLVPALGRAMKAMLPSSSSSLFF